MFGNRQQRAMIYEQLRQSNNAQRETTRAIMEHTKKYAEVKEKEIKAKDRVDISLEEYEAMKAKIRCLENKVDRAAKIFETVKLPWDLIEDGKVENILYFNDFDIDTNKREYLIKFSVDELDARRSIYL